MVAEIILLDEKRETFLWIFKHALPKLMGTEFCLRVNVIMADGDIWQKEVVRSVTGPGNIYPNASFRTCAWHLVNLKTRLIANETVRNRLEKLAWDVVRCRDEGKVAKLLREFEGAAAESGEKVILDLYNAIQVHIKDLADAYFVGKIHLNVRTTSRGMIAWLLFF